METTRQIFANDILYQAEWRSQKAAEYPEDERNARAAAALERLSAWFRALPEDDPVVVKIVGALNKLYGGDVDAGSFQPSVTELLGRFRFDNHPAAQTDAENREFIEYLASETEAYIRHAADVAAED
jgi:hypothetical protein